MTPCSEPRAGRRAPRSDGFSLLEVLIAAAMLLIIIIGLLPLFTRAMQDNAAGQRATETTNAARSEIERLMQLDFDHADLTLPAGENELESTDYFTRADYSSHEKWTAAEPSGGAARYQRNVIVRQYTAAAIEDGVLDPNEAVPGGTGGVQYKEIVVQVASPTDIQSPAKRVTLRMIRAL